MGTIHWGNNALIVVKDMVVYKGLENKKQFLQEKVIGRMLKDVKGAVQHIPIEGVSLTIKYNYLHGVTLNRIINVGASEKELMSILSSISNTLLAMLKAGVYPRNVDTTNIIVSPVSPDITTIIDFKEYIELKHYKKNTDHQLPTVYKTLHTIGLKQGYKKLIKEVEGHISSWEIYVRQLHSAYENL